MTRVTVQAIADRLGLSKFAVSRALSGNRGVSEATRKLVVETASAMGYVPRRPAASRLGTIEILYPHPDVSNRELWVRVEAGAQQEAERLNTQTTVRWTGNRPLDEEIRASALGFLLIGPHGAETIESARITRKPCVRLGAKPLALDPMDHIAGSDAEGGSAVALHLLGLGHRHFLFVHGRPGMQGRIDRHASFVKTVERTTGTKVREMVFPADNDPKNFRNDLVAMVARDFQPTAFFCGNDVVALAVQYELTRIGVNIPEDVSVVGYADYALASQVFPPLTTVRVPYEAIGRAAVRQLLSRQGLYGPMNDLPPQRIGLAAELIRRASSGPAPEKASLPMLLEEARSEE